MNNTAGNPREEIIKIIIMNNSKKASHRNVSHKIHGIQCTQIKRGCYKSRNDDKSPVLIRHGLGNLGNRLQISNYEVNTLCAFT